MTVNQPKSQKHLGDGTLRMHGAEHRNYVRPSWGLRQVWRLPSLPESCSVCAREGQAALDTCRPACGQQMPCDLLPPAPAAVTHFPAMVDWDLELGARTGPLPSNCFSQCVSHSSRRVEGTTRKFNSQEIITLGQTATTISK